MNSRLLNTIGLVLGIIGVLFLFVWGPPQPSFEAGVSVGLENATPLDSSGKTVADHNRELEAKRKFYYYVSYWFMPHHGRICPTVVGLWLPEPTRVGIPHIKV